MRIAIGINDHSEQIIQSVLDLVFEQDLVQLHQVCLVGHEPLLRQSAASYGIAEIKQVSGWPTIETARANVRIIPCHTVTPAEMWSGRRELAPGEITQKSLDRTVKLGMEFKIDLVFFTTFSIQALRVAGFLYESLSSLLSEWTRIKVEERIFSIPTGAQLMLFQHLPFLALAPFPVEYERQDRRPSFSGADLMEMIRHGINCRPEKNRL